MIWRIMSILSIVVPSWHNIGQIEEQLHWSDRYVMLTPSNLTISTQTIISSYLFLHLFVPALHILRCLRAMLILAAHPDPCAIWKGCAGPHRHSVVQSHSLS